MKIPVLDHGYVELVEFWGSDKRIIEAARMSTQKGFLGWGPKCLQCGALAVEGRYPEGRCPNGVAGDSTHTMVPGDEKLLRYLWDNNHATPFEMAGATIEVKAPIFVFREWHRHRTQSYNEMSARYIPLPNENYVPTADRLVLVDDKNKQAQGATKLNPDAADLWLANLDRIYNLLDATYQAGLQAGIPKEIARVIIPVGRYSAMRASANLRNWLAFLKLRCDPSAQWEIRQYANAVAKILESAFPRTYDIAKESIGLP